MSLLDNNGLSYLWGKIKSYISGQLPDVEIEEKTASGEIATFDDGGENIPMKSVVCEINPVQDLHGYDHPWVGGSGKNKLKINATSQTVKGVTFTVNDDGSVTVNGTTTESNCFFNLNYVANQFNVPTNVPINIGLYGRERPSSLKVQATGTGGVSTISYAGTAEFGISENSTLTTTSASTSTWTRLQIQDAGTTINNVTVYPFWCYSDNKMTFYEPYSNICPISGHTGLDAWVRGKNLLQNTQTTQEIKGITFTVNSDGSVTANGTATAGVQFTIPIDTSAVYGDLYFVGCSGGSNSTYNTYVWDIDTNRRVRKWDGTTASDSSINGTFQQVKIVQGNTVCMVLRIMSGQTVENVTFYPMICSSTETDSTYEPYNPQSQTISISWKTEAGEVYGGYVDLVSGELKVVPYYASYNGETLEGEWISDRDVYAVGTTPTIGAQVVNIGATPQTYQLTPTQVKSLLGTNNVWHDCNGDISVTYVKGNLGGYVYGLDKEIENVDTKVENIKTQLPTDFNGATTASAGTHGLVPAPGTTDTDKFLRGDGSWADGGTDVNVTQTESTANENYEVLVSGTASTATTTEGANKSAGILYNPKQKALMIGTNTYVSTVGQNSFAQGLNVAATGSQTHAEGLNTSAYGTATHSEGYTTTAKGSFTHAEGSQNFADGTASHAEGYYTTAIDSFSHTEGNNTYSKGTANHAEGSFTTVMGQYSHVEGANNYIPQGYANHIEGYYNQINGSTASHIEGYHNYINGSTASHAEGYSTTVMGNYSHSEGNCTHAEGDRSHSEGNFTTASGYVSHSEGDGTLALGQRSHAEGYYTIAQGDKSHTEGHQTKTVGEAAHTEGGYTTATGDYSHTEGEYTQTLGTGSHAEGEETTAGGRFSHSEGYETYAQGDFSHAEGEYTLANGYYSHAEGLDTTAHGSYAHAEGYVTIANGAGSHAEGWDTYTEGSYAHAEGYNTTAISTTTHSEGESTLAYGRSSHAEGQYTYAQGENSHAEGYHTYTRGKNSHTAGNNTTALFSDSYVFGAYNLPDGYDSTVYSDRGNYIEIVGNGNSVYNKETKEYDTTYSNARTLDWSGNEVLSGKLTVGTAPTADMDVATKKYVDDADNELSSSKVSKVHKGLTLTRTENNYVDDKSFARLSAFRKDNVLFFICNLSLSSSIPASELSDFVEIGRISDWSSEFYILQNIPSQKSDGSSLLLRISQSGIISIYSEKATLSWYRAVVSIPARN